MAVVNISLPDGIKRYVDEQLSGGRFNNASEYFLDLVREDQKRRAQERLEALLLEGLNSGEPVEVTEEYIRTKRSELVAKIEGNKARGR